MLPLALIVFLVTGLIFLGVATPSEAAATGALGCFILAAAYKRLNWKVTKVSTRSSLRSVIMLLFILASATAYSQILAFSGASEGLVKWLLGLGMPKISAIIGVQVIIGILGCFMPTGGILMIVMPMFTPIVIALGFDPVWFGLLTLINCEMGGITPPFGMTLFTMHSVAPKGTTLQEVYNAALPFIAIDIFMIVILFCFPSLALWLPSFIK